MHSPFDALKRAPFWIVVFAAYYLSVCAYAAHRNMMWVDEFCSWNVLADPSWRHAFVSYSSGADSGGVLFYLLGRLALAIFGLHPLLIRFLSSLAFWLAGLLWWLTLRRLLSTFSATAAVLLVWLGSGLFFFHAGEVRFYGLFFFAFSLTAAHLLNLRRLNFRGAALVASTFTVHLLLVTSHSIGLLYSAALLVVALLSKSLSGRRLRLALAILASWSVLLFFHQALSQQARISWMVAPGFRNFLRYYEKTPLTGAMANLLFLLAIAAGGAVALYTPPVLKRFRETDVANWLTLVLLLTPPAFAIVSQIARPIAADRYMMPAICGFLMAFAAALFALEQRYRPLLPKDGRTAVLALLVLLTVTAHARMLLNAQPRPRSALNGMLAIRSTEAVVLDDTNSFFQMRYYYPEASQRLAQIAEDSSLANPVASGNAVLLHAGYLHQVFAESVFLSQHPRFLYIDTDPQHASWLALRSRHPNLRATVAGQMTFQERRVPVLQVTVQ